MSENKRNKQIHDSIAKNYDRMELQVPKGEKEKIKQTAEEKGYKSVQTYLYSLYLKDIGKTDPKTD